jgi:RNA polymerase sigma-70 factor (ECF subfamily)
VDKEPDQALVERFRNGDRTAFARLVKRYHAPLYNAAFRVLGNAEDAADTTQVVFLRVAEKVDEYDPQHKFFSWVYRIALNESLNLKRRNGREEPQDEDAEIADDGNSDPEWQASAAQRSRRIQKALMSMTLEDRTVLTLRHFSDCSYREMSFILGLEEKTVKSRLFEARQRLSVLLDDLRTVSA